MTDWTETYRGTVPFWQCDVTEHFTVAYYFDRVEEAEANLADELGLGALPIRARRLDVRLVRELRAGASFHVESAALGIENGLRLGHCFVDSTSGETVSWFDTHWDPSAVPPSPEQSRTIAGRLATWTGPEMETRPEPTTTDGFLPTARGRTKPGDLDSAGQFSLSAMVHRFSNASGQTAAAIGMDTGSMQQQRRGFSTFEMILRVSGALSLDEPYRIETAIGHLGNSSLRMIHRMTNARTGAEIARLSQYGVNLDLDARRPTRWPEDVRTRAAALIVPVG
jgi:acyl-CoA thioesterase FadM